MPTGQSVQADAAEGEKDPAGQSVKVERSAELEMAPAGAGMHAVEPAGPHGREA